MNPRPGMIYDRGGELLMFVRREKRPGGKRDQDFYVGVRDRTVVQHWRDDPLPAADLVCDKRAREDADAYKMLLDDARSENGLLIALLKRACDLLPGSRADEIRREYVRRTNSGTHSS